MDEIMRARDALNHIDAGCAHDEWVRIGMSAKSAGLEFDDFNNWSATAGNYGGENECRAVWKSFNDSGAVTPATLFWMASNQGWKSTHEADRQPRPSLPITTPKQTAQKPSTSLYARQLWDAADREDNYVGLHPYAKKKGIGWAAGAGRTTASGSLIGRNADCLIVPIRTDAIGEVQGVQVINPDGEKQTFGKISGGCLVLGNTLDLNLDWYVCEGWASAVSAAFHHRKGNAVAAAAFGKGNLDKTAKILERVFDPKRITILGERDE